MTARITSAQITQFQKLAGDALRSINLTKAGAQRILAQGKAFQNSFREMILSLAAEYFVLLTDDEAVVWIVEHAKKAETEARQIVVGFRNDVRRRGISDDVRIHAEVRSGALFKRDLSQMGPTWEEFTYLQGWDFPDPPTEHALVSWIPVPLAGSTNQNMTEQAATLAAFKTAAALPPWYEVSSGSVTHVGGMALAHYQATGKDPFAGLVVRTETCLTGGNRLELFWNEGRLCCVDWDWDGDDRLGDLAVFALGVVKALGPSGPRR